VLKTYGDAGPIALLFVLESIIFVAQVISDVAPYYPPHSDQVGYLFESYKFTQQMKHEGLGAALLQLIQPFQPQGFLLPLQGGLMGLFIGLPRLGALTVNLLYFLLLQAVVFITFKRISGDRLVAWTAIALVLLMSAPFYWAGGIFDFRLDFAALCLFGIWCCVVLRSDWYLGTYWSVIAGIVGAWLVCTRYFSILYVGTIMIMIFLVEIFRWRSAPISHRRSIALLRLRNMLVSGAIIVACATPFLWVNRRLRLLFRRLVRQRGTGISCKDSRDPRPDRSSAVLPEFHRG
jgi:hypothetical protein